MSQHIRKLEDTLDAKLFARDKGRVVPTPAGDGYYRHCIELLNTYAKAPAASSAPSSVSRAAGMALT